MKECPAEKQLLPAAAPTWPGARFLSAPLEDLVRENFFSLTLPRSTQAAELPYSIHERTLAYITTPQESDHALTSPT